MELFSEVGLLQKGYNSKYIGHTRALKASTGPENEGQHLKEEVAGSKVSKRIGIKGREREGALSRHGQMFVRNMHCCKPSSGPLHCHPFLSLFFLPFSLLLMLLEMIPKQPTGLKVAN